MDKEAIAAENFRLTLHLYQRAVIWSIVASAVFMAIATRAVMGDGVTWSGITVDFGAAFLATFLAVVLLGLFEGACLDHAIAILNQPAIAASNRAAVSQHPSIATLGSRSARVGAVLLTPALVSFGFAIGLAKEKWQPNAWGTFGLLIFLLGVGLVYGRVVRRVWNPVGGVNAAQQSTRPSSSSPQGEQG